MQEGRRKIHVSGPIDGKSVTSALVKTHLSWISPMERFLKFMRETGAVPSSSKFKCGGTGKDHDCLEVFAVKRGNNVVHDQPFLRRRFNLKHMLP